MAPPIPKGLTLKDLMSGVADVHKAGAALPGAQAFEIRDLLRGKTHGQMAKIASDKGIFGTLPSGEPVRAAVMSSHSDKPIKKNMPRGMRDDEAMGLVLHPESERPEFAMGFFNKNPTLSFEKNIDEDYGGYFKTGPLWDRVAARLSPYDKAGFEAYKKQVMSGDPNAPMFYHESPVYNINAQFAGGKDPKWRQYKSQGSNLYSLGYDMSRAPGGEFGITADTLTDVNTPRRLRNALSHYFGHGDFGTISPLNENKITSVYSHGYDQVGRLGPLSSQSFRYNLDDMDKEIAYLAKLVPPAFDKKLSTMGSKSLAGLTDDEMAGYMLMREAQLANAYGPSTKGLGPFDIEALKALSVPTVKTASERGSTGLARAFGPNTLGRALTTEEAVARILKGQTPEEISYELFKNVPGEAIKGRYAKGGLATALDT